MILWQAETKSCVELVGVFHVNFFVCTPPANGIGHAAGMALAKALKVNSTLQTIDLECTFVHS